MKFLTRYTKVLGSNAKYQQTIAGSPELSISARRGCFIRMRLTSTTFSLMDCFNFEGIAVTISDCNRWVPAPVLKPRQDAATFTTIKHLSSNHMAPLTIGQPFCLLLLSNSFRRLYSRVVV